MRLYFIGSLFTLTPFAIVCGIAALFGADSIQVGGAYVHGWPALFASITLAPFLAFVFAFFWLIMTWPGLWLLWKFRTTTISFYGNDASP